MPAPPKLDAPSGHRSGPAVRFELAAERSAILVVARSTVGAIEFGMTGLEGFIEVRMIDGRVDMDGQPLAHVDVRVAELRSGNQLYDAELYRRIDAKRFPIATIDLSAGRRTDDRYQLEGDLTFHGVQRAVGGTVTATMREASLIVDGEQSFDIRDFNVASPTVLMFKIFPDVRVQLHVEADTQTATAVKQ